MKLSNKALRNIAIAVGIAFTGLVTTHVSVKEATVTQTGVVNIPDSISLVNLNNVCTYVYEPCYRHFKTKIHISSGFRCWEVNTLVGGQRNSQHLRGEALDLLPRYYGHVTNHELYTFIRDSLEYDQLIMEGGGTGWIHVSYRKNKNRKQAFKIN